MEEVTSVLDGVQETTESPEQTGSSAAETMFGDMPKDQEVDKEEIKTEETQEEEKTEETKEQTEETEEETKAEEVIDYGRFDLPEDVPYNEGIAKMFSETANKLQLKKEGAQELVDLYVEINKQAQADQVRKYAEQNQQWIADGKIDPEIGGANYDKTLKNAAKFRDVFGGKNADGVNELAQFCEQYPVLMNHPIILKVMSRAGAFISEDQMVQGIAGASAKSTADVMFSDMTGK